MGRAEKRRSPKILSFSGVDGAGKSTQIRELQDRLENRSLHVLVIPFWDRVACLKAIRQNAGHTLFRGDLGVGHPTAPIERRDKNVQSVPMTAVRYLLYLLDAIATSYQMKRARRADADVVIFDRFIYDELANLNMRHPVHRIYSRLVMMLVSRPDVSFILDADPMEARARKPEYPLEFVKRNRESYLALSAMMGAMTVISPMSVECVRQAIDRAITSILALSGSAPDAALVPIGL